MIEITYNGKKYKIKKGQTLGEISKEIALDKGKIVAGIVDGVVRSLSTTIEQNHRLEFLDVTTRDGHSIMLRTITLVFIAAVRKLCPEKSVSVEYRMGDSLYIMFSDESPMKFELIDQIKEEMKKIIASNIRFEKHRVDMKTAMELFEKEHYFDKIRLYETLNFKEIDLYTVGDHVYTMHGYLAPSSGYIEKFELTSYYPGAMITIPSRHSNGKLSEFREEKSLAKIFSNSKRWTDLLDLGFVANLNERIEQGNTEYLIRVNETYFENQISSIAKRIIKDSDIMMILISGPSSSGKTTLSQRLSVQLGARGRNCIAIHMDDYFVNREDTPVDEYGNKDYEALEAVDLKQFNEDLLRLIEGEEVELPEFDFFKGIRKMSGKKIRLEKGAFLLIEGIHGLNPALTQKIPDRNKFKIYVSALTQLNIDCHNRISTTDMRLLRRIVRDHEFRGRPAEQTLEEWPNVRRGEIKYIFPFQDLADAAIDSSLIYEVSILKKHVEELFKNFNKNDKNYKDVYRLRSFLKYFHSIDNDDIVPRNSILREFINKR